MKNFSLAHLKSSTGIRGTATSYNFSEQMHLTDDVVSRIAGGFVNRISNHTPKEQQNIVVAMGHDSRLPTDRLSGVFGDKMRNSGFRNYI